VGLAVGDPGQDAVEVVSGEGRLERARDLGVVLAKAQEPVGQRVEVGLASSSWGSGGRP
jgi:hypothetical protein